MSGTLSLIRELRSLYGSEQSLSAKRRTFWVLVRIAFILSAVVAWYGEHQQVSELRDKLGKPDIQLTVEEVSAGKPFEPQSAGDSLLVFYCAVKNIGPMPSTVDGWKLRVNVANRGMLVAENVPVDQLTVQAPSGEVVRIGKENALFRKTLHPIQWGGMEKGILVFILRQVSSEQLENATYTLEYRDVVGKLETATGKLSLSPSNRGVPFVPGIEEERVPPPSPTATPQK